MKYATADAALVSARARDCRRSRSWNRKSTRVASKFGLLGSNQERRRRQDLRPAALVADQGHAESGREGWREGIMRQATALARRPAAAVGSAQWRRPMQVAMAATP
jgi:hypothetical protein